MNKILVVGSINLDEVFSMEKLPEKNENVLINSIVQAGGGKGANLALALSRLDEKVSFYAKVGDDRDGEFLLDNLRQNKLATDNIVVEKDMESGKAYVFVDKNSDNCIMVKRGANYSYGGEDFSRLDRLIEEADLVMIQLEINIEAIEFIIDRSRHYGKKLIVDAGPIIDIDYALFKGVYILSPNKSELENLVGRKINNFEELRLACKELNEAGIENLIVKLGSKGSYYRSLEKEYYQEIYQVKSIDSTAAGDSYMAGLAKGLSDGFSIEKSMDLASKCGALATTKMGATASLPFLKEVENFNPGGGK